jgi:hypothetical protein
MRATRFVLALPLGVVLAGCPKTQDSDPLTRAEAQDALDEAQASGAAESLGSANIEIFTSFTLGAGLQQAASELETAVETELPCAEVTLDDATLTVDWGVNPGNCTYRGHTFTGTSSVAVEKNADNQVLVHHEWTDLSNGVVKLNGSADVTWDFSAKSRHIVHRAEWTHLATGRTGQGDGDRTQTPLAGGVTEGIRVEGTRSWTGKSGRWDLAIDGVEMRWQDPIPQAGSYSLTTPAEKSCSLSFSRVDDDTIRVMVEGTKRSFSFDVTSQ